MTSATQAKLDHHNCRISSMHARIGAIGDDYAEGSPSHIRVERLCYWLEFHYEMVRSIRNGQIK